MRSDSPLPDRIARPVHPAVLGSVLRYVELAGGPEALTALLAGLPPWQRAGDVVDPHRWATRREFRNVVAAAARICGDDQIGRRAGEEEFRAALTTPFSRALRATGSVGAACHRIAAHSSRISLGRRPRIVEEGPQHVVIESTFLDPAGAHRVACDYQAGYFSQIPTLFGALGTAVETECRARGGARCLLRIAWRPDPTRVRPDGRLDTRGRSEAVVDSFEESQLTAARLVDAADVDELLEEVVRQARQKVHAPQVVLAVRLPGEDLPRVHHVGFDDGGGPVDLEELATGDPGRTDRTVTADITAGARAYGRLAAVFPPGSAITDADRRMVHAYARHVAAALHALATLERAKRDRDTARALLGLARAFSEVTSVPDVASRLTLAIPGVTGSDVATVWLFDPTTRRLRLAGCRDRDGNEVPLEPAEICADDFPDLVDAMWARHPTMLRLTDAPAGLRSYLLDTGTVEQAIVPIAARTELLGIVTAGFRTPVGATEQAVLFDALRGVTAHGATALQNAQLLERMRHEALHDTLTGLPNRSLAEDRGRQALAALERSTHRLAILFLDLDGFKEVNDTHGHHVGDGLIRQVAARLDGLMRLSDTVARVGGDEFVVLLPEIESEADAVEVARRIIDAVERPVRVEGHDLHVSCSIGVASAAGPCPYDDLLRRADAAMYVAKARGGHGHAVDAPVVDLADPVVVLEAPVVGR